MLKLSVIVPVYNVAPYLRKCVESLLKQDLSAEEYEIILVDDGSTDGSGELCDEFASSNELESERISELGKPVIRVIHQKNGGLSSARNTGLAVAKGKYVQFVDSDDYLEPNRLGSLMEQVEREGLDVLRFGYQNVNEHYEVYEPNKTPRNIDKRTDVVDGETYLNTRMGYACYVCQFLLNRNLFCQDKSSVITRLFFKDGIYFEDTEWVPRMLISAKRVNGSQTIVYNYLSRKGSITKTYNKEHVRKKNNSLMHVNLSLQRLLPIVKDGRWINGCIADNVHNILNNAATYDYESVPALVKTIKVQHMLPLKGYKVRKISMLRYKLINLSPRLYCWLRHVRMKCLK